MRRGSIIGVCPAFCKGSAGLLYDQYQGYGPVLWITLLLAAISVGVMFIANRDAAAERAERLGTPQAGTTD